MPPHRKYIRTPKELFDFAAEVDLWEKDRSNKDTKHLAIHIKPRAERCCFDVILPATDFDPQNNLGSVKTYAEAKKLRDDNL